MTSNEPAPVDNATERFPELDIDYLTVPGQQYVVLSLVGPEGTNQRNDKFGLKIRGCFATVEEAHAHVNRLRQVDTTMDIYVADMYKWLLIPPDPNAIDNQEYQEQFMNDLIKGYRTNQALAKQHFLERKEAVKKDGLDAHLLDHERMPPPTDQHAPATDAQQPIDTAMFEVDDPLTRRATSTDPGPSTAP